MVLPWLVAVFLMPNLLLVIAAKVANYREITTVAAECGAAAVRYFRRAGSPDVRSCCDRRTCRRYARGEAREGYARVSFLGALNVMY